MSMRAHKCLPQRKIQAATLEKHQAPSLTWKESWNLLSRKAGAFCQSQTRLLWEFAEGSRALLSKRNIMGATDVSHIYNLKCLNSHIKKNV